jgi:hypothetical protein
MRVRYGIPLLVVAACGGPKISKQKATSVIEAAAPFKSAKLVYVPRVLAIPADGIVSSTATREGEALNIIQIASVDPVVAVLRARDQVAIEDFVSAVQSSIVVPPPKPAEDTTANSDSTKSKSDSTKSPNDSTKPVRKPPPLNQIDQPHTSPPPAPPLAQAWIHTLRVTPRVQLETSELAPDDGDDNPEAPRVAYSTRPIGRTPGWTLAVGAREFVRILEVAPYAPTRGDPLGEARVDFLWRWRATRPGTLFDTESAEFQSLPKEVQQAALTGGITIDTSSPHWSRAILDRDGAGWKVTNVDWAYGDDKPHGRW